MKRYYIFACEQVQLVSYSSSRCLLQRPTSCVWQTPERYISIICRARLLKRETERINTSRGFLRYALRTPRGVYNPGGNVCTLRI